MQTLENSQHRSSLSGFLLLASLVLIWGFTWPAIKIALIDITPLWLASIRMIIASICLVAFLGITKNLKLPGRQDLPIIVTVALLQMTLYLAFTNIAMVYVDMGRSAILAYTTPIWVLPLALLILKERLSILKACGLLLGVAGVFILFNPNNFDWSNRNVVIGNGLLLVGALAWAICIVHNRAATRHLTTLQLLPWQIIIATTLLIILSFIFEPEMQINWTPRLLWLLGYIGPVATALGYWLIIEVSRRLPSMTTSLCMLAVPVMGILTAYFLLGETIHMNMLIAIMLIGSGLVLAIKSTVK